MKMENRMKCVTYLKNLAKRLSPEYERTQARFDELIEYRWERPEPFKEILSELPPLEPPKELKKD